MLNPQLVWVYSLLGIYGGGVYPVVLVPCLCYTYLQFGLAGVDRIQGEAFKITIIVERSLFLIINVSAVIVLRIYWPRISRTLSFLSRARKAVGSRMWIHPHTLVLFIIFTSFNVIIFIQKSILANTLAQSFPEFLHFLVYNSLMVQYTDVVWTVVDLFSCLNRTLARELARPDSGKKWLKLIELHRHLVNNAEELHGCFRFHMLIAISYVFLKMIMIPYQVIRNWMRPAVGSLVPNSYVNLLLIAFNVNDILSLFRPPTEAQNQVIRNWMKPAVGSLVPNSYVNLVLIAFDLNYVISLFRPPTVAQDQSNNTRKVLREFANKGRQRKEILCALRILSENELKFTFYGLINVRTMSFVPMLDAITTNLVILLNYN